MKIFLALLFTLAPLLAATLPAGFSEASVAAGSVNTPTSFAFAPDGRIFICEQGGAVRIVKNGVLLATPFITFSVDSAGERGLLGIAFDPDFVSNQFVYFYYTTPAPQHNQVVRVTASGDTALALSEVLIFPLNNLSSATNHNGGAIHFAADGKLLIGVGDNANGANSQTLSNLLGKVLRINRDGSIPFDNPFLATATGNNGAIWAFGLRNPYTFAIQRGSGRIFINDVGLNTFEEINDGIAGSNYGWPNTEGLTNQPQYRSPLLAYGHGSSSTTGCAIAGGAFYNPQVLQFPPTYLGKYFFADYCSGWIRLFDPITGTSSAFATGVSFPVDLAIGPDGELYYLSRGAGMVVRVISTVAPPPHNAGIFRSGFYWLQDVNGDQQFAAHPDRAFAFGGVPGDVPLIGDWNGTGTSKVGIYRPNNGIFILDYDGDGQFTGADKVYNLGIGTDPSDIPIAGDWNGDGRSEVGLFRQGFLWILDYDGNGTFNSLADRAYAFGGVAGDVPVVGDWSGDGISKIGLFRSGFLWILDRNGNGVFDEPGLGGADQVFPFGGIAGDIPVVGDWNRDGVGKVGVFRQGFFWVLDANGNRTFDGTALGQDYAFPFGGIGGDVPVVGKW